MVKRFLLIFIILSLNLSSQNEDFETPVVGPITSSVQVPGWILASASNTVFSNSYTRFCDTLLAPIQAEVITHPSSTGFTDTLIGSQYQLFSVFGPVSNSGANYNPQIDNMSGNSFLKIGRRGGYQSYYPNFYQTSKRIKVDPTNCIFQYAYIYVGGQNLNPCYLSPLLKTRITNLTNSNVLNANTKVVSKYPSCPVNSNDYFYNYGSSWGPGSYNKWKISTVDLSGFVGDSIKVDFVVNNDGSGSWYCYAYLDSQCKPGMIYANNIINITGSVTSCSSANLSATSGYNYVWNGPIGSNITNISTQSITVNVTGIYTLSMSQGTTTVGTQTIYADILTPFALTFTSTCSGTICKGESCTLTVDQSNLINFQYFEWNTGSVFPSIIITPTIAGVYIYGLNYLDVQGCTSSFVKIIKVDECLGIKENLYNEKYIRLYPNPNRGTFRIISEVNASFDIHDNLGRLLQTVNLTDENSHVQELSGFKPGIYFVRSQERVFKLVVSE